MFFFKEALTKITVCRIIAHLQTYCIIYAFVSGDSRGVAQPGSATALGAVGREFESLHPDQFLMIKRL